MIDTSEDFIKEVGSLKTEQWKRATEVLKVVKGFIDVDTGVFEAFSEDIKSTLTLKMEELTAPLQNELDELWVTILKPIMPLLQDIVAGLATVVQWVVNAWGEIGQTTLPPPFYGGSYGTYYDWLIDNPTGSYNDYLAWKKSQVPLNTYLPNRRGGVQEP